MTDGFPQAAAVALRDSQQRRNLRKATTTIRAKRERAVAELADWEQLRDAGRQIKTNALARLDEHLLTLEAAVIAAGGQVHWAADAASANRITQLACHLVTGAQAANRGARKPRRRAGSR